MREMERDRQRDRPRDKERWGGEGRGVLEKKLTSNIGVVIGDHVGDVGCHGNGRQLADDGVHHNHQEPGSVHTHRRIDR